MTFLLSQWRLIAALLALGGIVGGLLYYGHAREERGATRVQSMWDVQSKLIASQAAAQQAANALKDAQAKANNEKVMDEYEAQLKSARADSAGFALRMRNAYAAADASRMQAANDRRGALRASEIAASVEGVRSAHDRARVTSLDDAARLNTLSAQIKPQL